MKKILLCLALCLSLSGCGQYTSMIGPSITLIESGSVLQATTSYGSSYSAGILRQSVSEELKAEHEAQRKLIRKLDRAQSQLIQAEKMASTGQLAAGIAHEINNPMGFVTANLNTLEQYAHNLLETCQATKKLVASHAPEHIEALEDLFDAWDEGDWKVTREE